MSRSFEDRHIGPTSVDEMAMLHSLGYSDLESFIGEVVPANIAIKGVIESAIEIGKSEVEVIAELKSIAADRWTNHEWATKVEALEEKPGSLTDFKRAAFESMTNLWALEDPAETELDGMEHEVFANIDGVAMKGYIDRFIFAEDGSVVISDYKTGKIPNPRFKSEDDKFFQLLAYALMLEESDQEATSRVELLYLTQKAKHDLTVTPVKLNIARGVIVETRENIEASCATGEFHCNVTNLCDWCHYKKIGICPAHAGK